LYFTLVVTHDGLKVSRFQNYTTSNQDDVAAAGQKRDAVGDKDPSFGREQSARPDDTIYMGFVALVISTGVRDRLTVNMTGDMSVDGGQHVIQQYQVRTSIYSAGEGDAGSLTATQLCCKCQ
jgi:hypothetical protein